jgi:two-component system, chemotaxis family, CheB/CheR fusion protein
LTGEEDRGFEELLLFLQRSRGFDFRGYKRPSLMRRVSRRLHTLGIDSFEAYRDYLEADPHEFALLFNTILINVTAFFRDPPAWEFLAREILPRVLAGKSADAPVRVWSAGCASGEEAYTIAMVLAEAMGEAAFCERAKVYATDADEEALNQARAGAYPAKALEALDPARRKRYFLLQNGIFHFHPELRRCMIFGRHDLVQDAPISRLDLLVCRNTLMYFNVETQRRILSRFHFALNGDGHGNGYLFLGHAELLLTHGGRFSPVDVKSRIFAKVQPGASPRAAPEAQAPAAELTVPANRVMEMALDDAPVARIVIDAEGNLAFANARARALFSLNAKDIGRALSDLEISYRPVELRSLLEQAYAEGRSVTRARVERRLASGEPQVLDVTVAPWFDERKNPVGAGINFMDVTPYVRLQAELSASREEIQTANEALQSSNEELETTNEELQSSNEELETTNEELQSTNEELETMNEELQSTNEELQTVNSELRERTDELHQSNAFLASVLASLRGAAVVVNSNLDVLMWNSRAEDLWGLRQDEVQGKSLLNLDIGLPVAELRGLIRPCLSGEAEVKEVVLDAVNRRGKKIRCRVACTPLLVDGKKRDGVILMMDEMPA